MFAPRQSSKTGSKYTLEQQIALLHSTLQAHKEELSELNLEEIGGYTLPPYLGLLDALILETSDRISEKFTNEYETEHTDSFNSAFSGFSISQSSSQFGNPPSSSFITSTEFSSHFGNPPSSSFITSSEFSSHFGNPSSSSFIPSFGLPAFASANPFNYPGSDSTVSQPPIIEVPIPPPKPRTILPKPSTKNTDPIVSKSAYFLFPAATGYALFELLENMSSLEEIEYYTQSFQLLKEVLKLTVFEPFPSQAEAVASFQAIVDGQVPASLQAFLRHLPASSSITIGVPDFKLAGNLCDALENDHIQRASSVSPQICQLFNRGISEFFTDFTGEAGGAHGEKNYAEEYIRAQRGLAHQAYSIKTKFNEMRADFNIVQAISVLDKTDITIYTISKRMREWYSVHFPELAKILFGDIDYAKVVKLIGDRRNNISQVSKEEMDAIVGEHTAEEIFKAARASIGDAITQPDLKAIVDLADKIIHLVAYREVLRQYLHHSLQKVAPNLSALTGLLGARFIARAGSLDAVARMPACTIQLMGAEKAFFRAIRTIGNTPKYGIIFHSPFVGMASAKDKGKVARILANKAAIAARIDRFSDIKTNIFGMKLSEQMRERLAFINNPTGPKPKRNILAMQEAAEAIQQIKKQRKEYTTQRNEETEQRTGGNAGPQSPSSLFSALNL